MSQSGNAGKDVVQVGRDYFKHIQLNILSGNWGSVVIALIPLLLFFYGVKATGDTVAEVVYPKQSQPKLSENSSLVQAKNKEIGDLKKQVENFQRRINELSAKNLKLTEDLQKDLNARQTELANQKNLIQQKEQEIQSLKVRVKDLEDQLFTTPSFSEKSSNFQEIPFGTAPKSWCIGVASFARADASRGEDISADKALMEEKNCSYWGISIR